MNENQVIEDNKTPDEKPKKEKTSTWQQAQKDIQDLPPWGRLALAVVVIFVIFKATPILDLLWLFIQIFVIPMCFLVAWGAISHSTYMYFIGWLNEPIRWASCKWHGIKYASAAQEPEPK